MTRHWGDRKAFEVLARAKIPERNVTVFSWERESRTFYVSDGRPGELRVGTFYYPYWKAMVNGQDTQVKTDQTGVIFIPIPSDASKIHLYFEEPKIEIIAKYVSLLTWLFLAVLFISWLVDKVFSGRRIASLSLKA